MSKGSVLWAEGMWEWELTHIFVFAQFYGL